LGTPDQIEIRNNFLLRLKGEIVICTNNAWSNHDCLTLSIKIAIAQQKNCNCSNLENMPYMPFRADEKQTNEHTNKPMKKKRLFE
jgi:hypothetical protein